MDSNRTTSLLEHFSVLAGGRYEEKCLQNLIDIFIIAIVAVICGAEE